MLFKNFRPQNFAAQVGESKCQRKTANPTNLPQFWAFRVAIETLRSADALPKLSSPKFSRRNPGGRRFHRQTLEEEGSNNKPRMKLPRHNFWPPATRAKRCVAPLFRENFRAQNLRGPSWRKQVPRQTANATNLPQFRAVRVAIETLRSAQRFAKFFLPRTCAAQPWRKKVPKANLGRRRFQQHAANEATLPQVSANRVASETRRNAPVSRKFPHPKFTRPKLAETRPKDRPRIQPKTFAAQSQMKKVPKTPQKEKGSNDTPRSKPTHAPPLRTDCRSIAKTIRPKICASRTNDSYNKPSAKGHVPKCMKPSSPTLLKVRHVR